MPKLQAPRVVIFAGPNGAGKSTHADAITAALGIITFVNADYIARGLSGRNADAVAMQAGRPHHADALESAGGSKTRLCV